MMRGEEERIRPCVGAGYCLDRIYVGGDALCLHNPATGREGTMPHVVEPGSGPKRKVVVVGAGPAGLEAARVSALRGHEVVVFEAASEPGRAGRARGEGYLAQGPARHRPVAGVGGRAPRRRHASQPLRRDAGRARRAAGAGGRRHRRGAEHRLGRRCRACRERMGRTRRPGRARAPKCWCTTTTGTIRAPAWWTSSPRAGRRSSS